MNEEQVLDSLMPKWKGKYTVGWCYLCDCAYIICPVCGHNDCGCGGCDECKKDMPEWRKVTVKVQSYLTPEEIQTYEKCLSIKNHIIETIRAGQNHIDWKQLQKDGHLSEFEMGLLQKELSSL